VPRRTVVFGRALTTNGSPTRRRPAGWIAALVALISCGTSRESGDDAAGDASTPRIDGWAAPPVDAPFDYQLGGDYGPPDGVEVVTRDWFSGTPLPGGYSVCYVNAFQTEQDDEGVERPDERSAWPRQLVLSELGDDPDWAGEYLVDLSTGESRRTAAAWVGRMVDTCADKGFDAVEFDNLDSWTRFDGTSIADLVPFGPAEAAEYATLLTTAAHLRGMAVAQKNTLHLDASTRSAIGFDFLVVERCGELGECADAARAYGDAILAVEYEAAGFAAACTAIGERSSVVLRDRDLSTPESSTYRHREC